MEANLIEEQRAGKGFFKLANIVILLFIGVQIGLRNYLLFHTSVELTSVIVAVIILIIAFNTYNLSKNSYLLLIGIGYGFVGGFDFLHALAYKGMGIFDGGTANLATQFWITSRYLESITIFVSYFFMKKKLKPERIIVKYFIVSAILIVSILVLKIFPDCFLDGQGLTSFKIISEYIIIGILFISGVILIINRNEINEVVFKSLISSIVITIASEISFTLYSDVYGIQNMIGHLLKTLSICTIFRGIVISGLREPYSILYGKLDRANESLEDKTNLLENKNKVLNIMETEIKAIEEQLLKNEEVINMLTEFSEYSILGHVKGNLVFANKNVARMIGVNDQQNLIGRNIMDYIHPDYQEFIKEKIDSELEIKDTFDSMELKIVGNNGNEIYIRSMVSNFIYKGEPARLAVMQDITDVKILADVVEQDRLKTETFANISHDLKTPINVFFASLQLLEFYLKRGEFNNNINKVHSHIKTMKQNSYRVIRLVNNLVDITKIGAGDMKLKFCNLNIVSVIEDISMSVSKYMENKGIEFLFDTEIEEKRMAIDPDKIERIMLNILSNAIKFTNPGGSIEVDIYDIEDGIKVSIKDTGTGIPENNLTNVFERYKQVDDTLARNNQGSGIGLSLVKSLVELHGGQIYLKSQWGVGSEFIIELPSRIVEEENFAYKCRDMGQDKVERINIEFSDIYLDV